ncbi:MAG: hypoxanthine phosphoribosyltransferase [Spirosomataceae bacterium]
MIHIRDKSFVPFLSAKTLQARILELAQELNTDYRDKDPLFIGVLNGAFVFLSDLFKCIEIPCEVTFVRVSSYQSMNSTGQVKQILGLQEDIQNRHIILVEDIVDTGLTMQQITQQILGLQPASLAIVTLLHKPEALEAEIDLDYVGFEIENKFVVGYGLDYDGQGRNLDAVYVLAE